MQRRKFSREFKLEAVKLVRDRGVTIAGLERQMIRSAKRITPEIVEKFGVMVADKVRGTDPMLRKAYVHLLVDRVEVDASEIRITGSKSALEHAVLDINAAAGRVPSFDREWCPERDKTGHCNHWTIVLPRREPTFTRQAD